MPNESSRQPVKKTSKQRRPKQRRQRRSRAEIIARILDAAAHEFERNGYLRTTTSDIARRAEVAEPLIFNHFGSKAKLFQDAMFKPLEQHFETFCATHLVAPGDRDSLREFTRQYILELKQFVENHSGMLMSLILTQAYARDDVGGLSRIEGLQDYFRRASELAKSNLRGEPKVDPDLMSRVSFAAILACALFKDWLFPKGSASEDKISAAIVDFVMEGLDANAEPRLKAVAEAKKAASKGAKNTAKRKPKAP